MEAYDTVELLDAYRRLDPFRPFLTNLICNNEILFDTNEIAFDHEEIDMKLAPFVSPYVPGQIGSSQPQELRKFAAPYLKPKDVVDPKRVLKRRPGEGFSGVMTPAQRANAIRMDLMDKHRQSIRRREEWMVAQFCLTGKLVVSGPRAPKAEIDYRRNPNHTIDISGGAGAWNQTTAKPVEDFEDWFDMAESPISHVVFGKGAFRAALKDEDFKDLVETRRGSETQLEMAPQVNDAQFLGRFGGAGPEMWSYLGWYKDGQGQKQYYVPEGHVLLLSAAGVRGSRAYGAILDATAGYIPTDFWPKNFVKDDPGLEYMLSQSAPLPVFGAPDGSISVKVF